jgi:hypothetical protein
MERKIMYPEVQRYLDAVKAADAAWSQIVRQCAAAEDAAWQEARADGWTPPAGACCSDCAWMDTPPMRALNKVEENSRETRDAAQATAWDALRASEVPLVRWIAEECGEFRYEANEVLEALPASLEELDALARRRNWCGAWDNFRRRALAAGVVADAPKDSEVPA